MNTLTMLLEKSKIIAPTSPSPSGTAASVHETQMAAVSPLLRHRCVFHPFRTASFPRFCPWRAKRKMDPWHGSCAHGRFHCSAALLSLRIRFLFPPVPFAIGTRIYDLEDPAREEPYTETAAEIPERSSIRSGILPKRRKAMKKPDGSRKAPSSPGSWQEASAFPSSCWTTPQT